MPESSVEPRFVRILDPDLLKVKCLGHGRVTYADKECENCMAFRGYVGDGLLCDSTMVKPSG